MTSLCSLLPKDLSAAVFIVLHLPPYPPSHLPEILSRAGQLPAIHPTKGEHILPGRIYTAPADHHLIVDDGRVTLSRGPQENGYRPSIDTLFRTAARTHGQKVVGVLLSGMLSDGVLGLEAIHSVQGVTIVQDPQEAMYPNMPRNALRGGRIDFTLPVKGIAEKLVELARQPVPQLNNHNEPANVAELAEHDRHLFITDEDNTPRSLLTCPDCGGVLWEFKEGDATMFVCQIGHRYSLESMLNKQNESVEAALWAAVRALEERATLQRRMADISSERGSNGLAERFKNSAREAGHNADIIRKVLEFEDGGSGGEEQEEDIPDEETRNL